MHRKQDENGSFGIGELAEAAGVSTRTLRHYESIGLLSPSRTESGYRVYSDTDARRLAQIQAMKLCGLPLATIRSLMDDLTVDLRGALVHHFETLHAQERTLKDSMAHTKAAIDAIERIEQMETKDAFEQMKEKGLQDFETTYGKEARERYGDDAIDGANERMMLLSQAEWDAKEQLEESIKVQLRLAMEKGDTHGEAANELARMHERWIAIHWGQGYEKETYLALVRGYLDDPRFVKYYDSAAGAGATEFLVEAVLAANL